MSALDDTARALRRALREFVRFSAPGEATSEIPHAQDCPRRKSSDRACNVRCLRARRALKVASDVLGVRP